MFRILMFYNNNFFIPNLLLLCPKINLFIKLIKMTEKLSSRVAKMSPSATMAMNQMSREMKAQGVDIINLSVGEPDFYTPDHIKQSANNAINNNNSFYPPAAGIPELREAISKKFKRENNLDFSPEQIIVSCGAKNSLANVIIALIDKGDEVIVPAPFWVTYTELVKLAEGTNVIIPSSADTGFKVTPEQIEEKITSKTKALLLCSPSNPSGAVYTRDEMAAIAQMLAKHPQVFVISDEIYEHIVFDGEHVSIAEFDELKDRSVIINGVSKAYAMTGYRIGYLGAPEWLVKACIKLQGQLITGPATMAQHAAITALTEDQSCVAEMRKAFLRRRNMLVEKLNGMEGIKIDLPAGAFYVFPEITHYIGKTDGETTISSANDLSLYLLKKGHIATVPGEAFGNDDCIRISYANSDENLLEAMKRMKIALEKLK